jgi:predicted MFS family arabinose efflux permease
MSLVSAAWQALLCYGVVFAVGSGIASLTPVGVMVTHAFPERTGLANAAVISGTSIGQLVIIAALAAMLQPLGWRTVFLALAGAHCALLPLLRVALPRAGRRAGAAVRGLGLGGAAHTARFWLLIAVYAICGFNDFFVGTHIVAFAQDHGVAAQLAGNLLALMGLTGLIGVLAAGIVSDILGAAYTAAIAFAIRVAVFALIGRYQSTSAISAFALLFGATFLVTAPLTVLFVRDHFGLANLGALTGIVTMAHQIFGGIGAYGGALMFDATGSYDQAFAPLLAVSGLAFVLSLRLRGAPAAAPAD